MDQQTSGRPAPPAAHPVPAPEHGNDGVTGAAHQVADTASTQAGEVAHEARRQAKDLLGQARDQAAHQARTGQHRTVEGIRGLADELHRMSEGPDRAGTASDLAREAAGRLGDAADWLSRREPGDLLEEVRDFARRRPGTFLLGAAVAGVLAGRLTRGAVDANRGDDMSGRHAGPGPVPAPAPMPYDRPGAAALPPDGPLGAPGVTGPGAPGAPGAGPYVPGSAPPGAVPGGHPPGPVPGYAPPGSAPPGSVPGYAPPGSVPGGARSGAMPGYAPPGTAMPGTTPTGTLPSGAAPADPGWAPPAPPPAPAPSDDAPGRGQAENRPAHDPRSGRGTVGEYVQERGLPRHGAAPDPQERR